MTSRHGFYYYRNSLFVFPITLSLLNQFIEFAVVVILFVVVCSPALTSPSPLAE